MAFIVLFSTLSFTVESHYCGNNLIDTAIFTKAKVCGGNIKIEAPTIKHCCKNDVEVIKGQNELKLNGFDDLEQQFFFTSYAYSYISLFISLPKQVILHRDYTPPNLIFDIKVLYETFLI